MKVYYWDGAGYGRDWAGTARIHRTLGGQCVFYVALGGPRRFRVSETRISVIEHANMR